MVPIIPVFNPDEPRNAAVVRQLAPRNKPNFPPSLSPSESPSDPYLSLGSHPDVVARLWEDLAAGLPQDTRAVVYGVPALVAPRSGVLIAHAMGTAYLLRVTDASFSEALRLGAKVRLTFGKSDVVYLTQMYGPNWIFGGYFEEEHNWCLQAFNEVEH